MSKVGNFSPMPVFILEYKTMTSQLSRHDDIPLLVVLQCHVRPTLGYMCETWTWTASNWMLFTRAANDESSPS